MIQSVGHPLLSQAADASLLHITPPKGSSQKTGLHTDVFDFDIGVFGLKEETNHRGSWLQFRSTPHLNRPDPTHLQQVNFCWMVQW